MAKATRVGAKNMIISVNAEIKRDKAAYTRLPIELQENHKTYVGSLIKQKKLIIKKYIQKVPKPVPIVQMPMPQCPAATPNITWKLVNHHVTEPLHEKPGVPVIYYPPGVPPPAVDALGKFKCTCGSCK